MNSKIIEKNKNSIILVELFVPSENKVSIRGTGFIVSADGKFITCAHVYNELTENERQYLSANVPIKTNEKGIIYYKRYKAELLKEDAENDLALMRILSENNDKFLSIKKLGDSETVQAGEEVIFLGYPLASELITMNFGITMSANQCVISSVKRRGTDGSLHFLMVDTHINNGSSGSPVFLKSNGKIIGITSARISAKVEMPYKKIIDIPDNMGICRPINYAKNLLNN